MNETKNNKTWSSVSNKVLTIDPYPLSLVPYPLVLFLSRNLGEDSSSSSHYCCCCCYQAKVNSTPSPWPKTWSLIKFDKLNKDYFNDKVSLDCRSP